MCRNFEGFMNKERAGGGKLYSISAFIILSLLLTACAQGLNFKAELKSQVGSENGGEDNKDDDVDNKFEHPFNEGGDKTCKTEDWLHENFELNPDAIQGANVILLLDDSGSMTNEFQKVVYEIQDFIDGILAATGNNYRIGLIFDKDMQALAGQVFTDNNGNPITDRNPFVKQIADPNVFYFEKETWSKWADIALARVFMPATYMQTLPDLIPLDTPPFGHPIIPLENCQGMGKYYRPRANQSNFYNTPACITAQDALRIDDYFLPGITMNIVTVSDDDLNVNFDRNNFSWNDPTKNAYPEVVDLMIKDLIRPLGEDVDYVYHSIVGPTPGGGVELVGTAHMALSKKTGGGLHDIRTNDWGPLFDLLQEQIIFSEQKVSLDCTPSESIEVRFNGNLVDRDHYIVQAPQQRIRLLPEAFEAYPSDEPILVKVSYIPALE